MNTLLNLGRAKVRRVMKSIAQMIDTISGGKISPNFVTIFGLAMHIPIAWLISEGYFGYAGVGLIVFGLFDAVDGELARIQNKSTAIGMFVDSSTDRIKEILIYLGIVNVMLTSGAENLTLIIATAALGISVLTSYMNAWGEVVLTNFTKNKEHKTNSTFRGGLLSFDIRMLLIVIGLFINNIPLILWIIFVLGLVTVLQRFINITNSLKNV